jgi:hypothetical protein
VVVIPVPVIETASEIAGRSEVSVIVPVLLESKLIVLIVDEAFAVVIAQRRDPTEPSSNRLITLTNVGAGTVLVDEELAVNEPIELVLVTCTLICFPTSVRLIVYVADVALDILAHVHELGSQDCH